MPAVSGVCRSTAECILFSYIDCLEFASVAINGLQVDVFDVVVST